MYEKRKLAFNFWYSALWSKKHSAFDLSLLQQSQSSENNNFLLKVLKNNGFTAVCRNMPSIQCSV